jgi:hypothetical protein
MDIARSGSNHILVKKQHTAFFLSIPIGFGHIGNQVAEERLAFRFEGQDPNFDGFLERIATVLFNTRISLHPPREMLGFKSGLPILQKYRFDLTMLFVNRVDQPGE